MKGKCLHSLSQADTCSEICSPVNGIIFPALGSIQGSNYNVPTEAAGTWCCSGDSVILGGSGSRCRLPRPLSMHAWKAVLSSAVVGRGAHAFELSLAS